MRKVIKGNRYDTDTAKKLGESREESLCGKPDWLKETLYRTKAGNYFIHGEGGARTCYGGIAPDGWQTSGEKIIPITEERAMEWAEQYLDAEQYEMAFGAISEDTTRISVFLPFSLVERMDAKGHEMRGGRADIIRIALERYLQN